MPRAQTLPLDKMQWENFERLCLRLIRRQSTVRQCALYGVRGQDQAGIDFYAFDNSGEYSVYQCKRVKTITPSSIRSAVSKFQEGRWAKSAKRFVFCTTHDLTDSKVQDQVTESRELLARNDITFETLGHEDIVLELKELPRLVFDFFGRNIAADFCGEEIVASLGRRIEPEELDRLREELLNLYATVFRVQARDALQDDPTLAIRFTDLDVVERQANARPEAAWLTNVREDDHRNLPAEAIDRDGLSSPTAPPPQQTAPEFRRQGVLPWLGSSEAPNLILGEAGSGKSTVLRRVALDLLSKEPQIDAIAERFGDRIPLWMPFAALAKRVTGNGLEDRSLVALGKHWLTQRAHPEVGGLIERAFEDERLLLLVDGLDEFGNRENAGVALESLVVHVDNCKCDLVASGRPQSVEALELGPFRWRTAFLAPLTIPQRDDLVRRRLAAAGEEIAVAEAMLESLDARPELRDLTETPLFLSYLTDLWRDTRTIPDSRPAVHDAVLKLLLEAHTNRREQVAERAPKLSEDDLSHGERLALVLQLALEMQDARDVTAMRPAVEATFAAAMEARFGTGIGAERRRYLSRALLDTLAERNGLLLEVAEDEFAFFHRSMQEYLCARALAELPAEEGISRILARAEEPTWQESLRSFLLLIDGAAANALADGLVAFADANPQVMRLEFLLVEAAVGDAKLTPDRRLRLLDRAIGQIESRPWLPDRPALIGAVVGGLRDAQLAERSKEAVCRWFPARSFWQSQAFQNIAEWEPDGELGACLFRSLLSADVGTRVAAAMAATRTLNAGFLDREALRELATRDPEIERRAAALLALVRSDPDSVADLVAAAWEADFLPLRLVAAEHRVRAGERGADLLATLLAGLVEDAPVESAWTDFATPAVIDGWKGDAEFCDRLLALAKELPPFRESGQLTRSTINYLLASMFPGDQAVARFLASQFSEQFPFIEFSHKASFWQILARNFRDDPALVAAADAWLPERGRHSDVEASYAAMLGRTLAGKQVLLMQSRETFPHWSTSALIEGWGLEDEEVRDVLAWRLEDINRASEIANLVPEFEPDRGKARDLLLRMLHDRSVRRLDFALYGFVRIGVDHDDDEVLDAIFALRDEPTWPTELAQYAMSSAPWDDRAREVAVETLRDPEGFWGTVAYVYRDDPEMRRWVMARLTPLDPYARVDLVEALLRPEVPANVVSECLALYAADGDTNISATAAIGYYRQEAERDGVDALKPLLTAELGRGGIHHEERAQAAFAAALDLGVPEVLLGARFKWNPDRIVSVPLAHIHSPNVPLVRGVLRHWNDLHEMFGEDFVRRFGEHEPDMGEIWTRLVVAVDDFPEIAAQALDHFAATGPSLNPGYHQSVEVLAFLARADPGGPVLRQFCVPLVAGSGGDLGSWQAEQFAAELLALHFRGREDVLAELGQHCRRVRMPYQVAFHFTDGMLCALGDGWRESDLLDIAWEQYGDEDDDERGHAEGAIAFLWASRASSVSLMNWIDRRIVQQRLVFAPSRRARSRALAGRFRRDEDVRLAASDVVLDQTSSPSHRISMLHLLLASGASLPPEIVEFARGQLIALSKGAAARPYSDVGFDVLIGRAVSGLAVLMRSDLQWA